MSSEQRTGNILVVDDDPGILNYLKVLLTEAGHTVETAPDGDGAIRQQAETNPDAVLMDVGLPDMSGYDLATRLTSESRHSHVAIVMMSGISDNVDKVRALRAGAVDFLQKPLATEELFARIDSVLSMKAYHDHVSGDRSRMELQLTGASTKLEAMAESFSRFVPEEFLNLLEKDSIVDVEPGDHVQKRMAFLFSDIRSFTTLSEQMTPRDTFRFLNSYLKRMDPIIWEHNGFIDKYIGDAIMALFPGSAAHALEAATEMVKHLPIYNEHRRNFGYSPIDVGIGVHVGETVLGVIGHSRFVQGTVISSDVNLASRLEGLTKVYGVRLIVSSDVIFSLPDPSQYSYRFLDKTKVKGMEQPVSVFEVFDGEEPHLFGLKKETQGEFEQAVYAFHAGQYEQALDGFRSVRIHGNDDRAVDVYIRRCSRSIKLSSTAGKNTA